MLKKQKHGGSENAHPEKLNSHISQLCTSLLSG